MTLYESTRQLVKDSLTENNNKSFDVARVLWVIGVLAFIIFSGYAVWKSGEFDYIGYGTGLGIVLAAGGAAVALKNTNISVNSSNSETTSEK